MEPAIVWLRAYRLPRILGVILIYLAIALAVFFSIYLVFPLIFEEFEGLATTYPAIQEQVLSGIERVEILPFSSLLTENIEALIRLPAGFLIQLGGGVANFAGAVFGGVFSLDSGTVAFGCDCGGAYIFRTHSFGGSTRLDICDSCRDF